MVSSCRDRSRQKQAQLRWGVLSTAACRAEGAATVVQKQSEFPQQSSWLWADRCHCCGPGLPWNQCRGWRDWIVGPMSSLFTTTTGRNIFMQVEKIPVQAGSIGTCLNPSYSGGWGWRIVSYSPAWATWPGSVLTTASMEHHKCIPTWSRGCCIATKWLKMV